MNREQEVWACLAPVTDPELDESVTELGFVKSVSVNDANVQIRFHLPTYWCAANFAYMMASDMHQAVQVLPWVETVDVELLEHMYSETINRGIKASLSFQDTFGDEASDEIDAVRETFRKKAFQQRQELVLRLLLEQGFSSAGLVAMRMADLRLCQSEDPDEQRVLQRYLDIREERGGEAGPQQAAFVTVDGERLDNDCFAEYLQELRSTRINTQFNGEICRGLLQARYGSNGQVAGNPAALEVKVDFHPLTDFR